MTAAAVTVAGGSIIGLTAREAVVVYPATALELGEAVEVVFDELEITRENLREKSNEGTYTGRIDDGRELELRYEVLGERQLEVGVRCGWNGDEDRSAEVHARLREVLEDIWLAAY